MVPKPGIVASLHLSGRERFGLGLTGCAQFGPHLYRMPAATNCVKRKPRAPQPSGTTISRRIFSRMARGIVGVTARGYDKAALGHHIPAKELADGQANPLDGDGVYCDSRSNGFVARKRQGTASVLHTVTRDVDDPLWAIRTSSNALTAVEIASETAVSALPECALLNSGVSAEAANVFHRVHALPRLYDLLHPDGRPLHDRKRDRA
jgi:hypothetical protein